MNDEPTVILAASHFGTTRTVNGKLTIGDLEIPYSESVDDTVQVYVRRSSRDLSIFEIHIARHDGLDHEASLRDEDEAEAHPLGAKEYWRTKMVGKYTSGLDHHPMTDTEFEQFWAEDEQSP